MSQTGDASRRRRFRDGRDVMFRYWEGDALAATLVGLRADTAVRVVTDRAFDHELIPAGRPPGAVAAVFRPNCISLYVDEHGAIVRASCG